MDSWFFLFGHPLPLAACQYGHYMLLLLAKHDVLMSIYSLDRTNHISCHGSIWNGLKNPCFSVANGPTINSSLPCHPPTFHTIEILLRERGSDSIQLRIQLNWCGSRSILERTNLVLDCKARISTYPDKGPNSRMWIDDSIRESRPVQPSRLNDIAN